MARHPSQKVCETTTRVAASALTSTLEARWASSLRTRYDALWYSVPGSDTTDPSPSELHRPPLMPPPPHCNRKIWATSTLVLLLLSIGSAHAIEPVPGTLTEKIACRADPAYSYALALPSTYDSDHRWPVLYVLDTRGRALRAVERFRAGAERYGWILVSSWDTASDGPSRPNVDAMQAMLRDTQATLAIDASRIYLAGFSGTARLAWRLADSLDGHVAGIVAASGGFPDGTGRPKSATLPAFLTAGATDFNYQEMHALAEALTLLDGASHRLEVFDGGHEWPPAALGEKAIAWLELAAMARGQREVIPTFVSGLYESWLVEAQSLEDGGDLYGAYVAYRDLARDFGGLLEDPRAGGAAARLRRHPEVTETEAELEQLASQEAAHRRQVRAVSGTLLFGPLPLQVSRLAEQLDLRDLRRLAESAPESLHGQSARRRLQTAYVNTSFYLTRDLLEHGEYSRAVAALSLALEIDDSAPVLWYNRACARSKLGQKRKAIEDLERAVDLGFSNLDLLERDPDLAPLRSSETFRELVARLRVSR